MSGPNKCEVPDCPCGGAPAKARYMCPRAYSTWVTRGRPQMPGRVGNRMDSSSVREYAAPTACTHAGCSTKARGRGLCSKHLKRQQRNGSTGTRVQTCAQGGHEWQMDGPGRPSPFCPEHRPAPGTRKADITAEMARAAAGGDW